MVKTELILLFTSSCSFTHNCKEVRGERKEQNKECCTMPLAKTEATPAPAMATAMVRTRWEKVARMERLTEERRTRRREPSTT